MRRYSLLVARFLLAIFLATILNPGFAWDVVAAEADHDYVLLIEGHCHDDHALVHDEDHEIHQHTGHDRVGHLLSHLPATLPVVVSVVAMPARPVLQATLAACNLQNPPETFFRPPRYSSSV